jgi:hypothetical protein
MKIEISNTRDKIIEQYYTLVNPFLGKNRLGPVEIKVLSKMALIYNTYQHLGEEAANLLLFHTQSRKQIREAVAKDLMSAFSRNSHEAILSRLRKKGLITKTKIVYLPPIKDNKISIDIKLSIVNNDE